MKILTIGITIQDIGVTIVKNMDLSLRIALEHILVVTTRDGWVKPHVFAFTRLVTSASIVQLGLRHLILNFKDARSMLSTSEMKWTRHGRKKMLRVHQMEKGSLHPMGQVVTPHQKKKKEVCGTDIQMFYHTLVPRNSSTKKDRSAWIKMQDNKESSRPKFQIFTFLWSMKSPLHMLSKY